MYGLYNAMHGVNDHADTLLEWLGINQPDSSFTAGRFRDCYLNDDGTRIVLFTRNGGGNREQYQDVMDELSTHPCWVRDFDDDFDSTYAYIEFTVPTEFQEQAKLMVTGEPVLSLREKTQRVIDAIRNGEQP